MLDPSKTLRSFFLDRNEIFFYSLVDFAEILGKDFSRLPFSIRLLLEMILRQSGEGYRSPENLDRLADWKPVEAVRGCVGIHPQRVLMQDLTGVPVLNDLASLRAAVARAGGDPSRIDPLIPVDLVVDHSIQADFTGTSDAYQKNLELEFKRNRERYDFLHWAQQSFRNFRLIPPGTGIVHQVNLEALSPMVWVKEREKKLLACPDMVIGTDSHTPMINGLGILGWGVGGIEAIAAMLGNPLELPIPDVVGIRLSGSLLPGTTPTDLTLAIVQKLRAFGVVDKFVEFTGPALADLAVSERAMIANMSPEYGATASYFPVDRQTIDYLHLTARPEETIRLAEQYFRMQGLFCEADTPEPQFSTLLEVSLAEIEPSIAGPKKPQSRVTLGNAKENFLGLLAAPVAVGGYGLAETEIFRKAEFEFGRKRVTIGHGAVVVAAITSCTNTSNPYVMVTAGLLARNAVARGLTSNPVVKASLSPGSRVVTDYLGKAKLLEPLEKLGFALSGYGCMTCIGNSGQLHDVVGEAIEENQLVTAAVLSGNRNFEGRVQSQVRANYLASPPLVVAFALAGRMDIDLTCEPIGMDKLGNPVILADLWPEEKEIQAVITKFVTPEAFRRNDIFSNTGSREWQNLETGGGIVYGWQNDSTYLREPPFLKLPETDWEKPINGARALVVFGDAVTTDHISPAGNIPVNSPAGRYFVERKVSPSDFNSYGARRGNDEVMVRGTFANIRLKNRLVQGVEGGKTLYLPERQQMDIYDAAMRYREEGVPLIVLAGREYGTGSSRDWAAKGVLLLGVRAVIAESFERIHRSNLAGMGVLPLEFLEGENLASLGLTGQESFSLPVFSDLEPGDEILITAKHDHEKSTNFKVRVRVNSKMEMETLLQGGILKKAFTQTLC
jgi:aconitate hydratase